MDAASSRRLFDANASTYDRVNSLISLGLDARWRSWAAHKAVGRTGARVLDAFAGTGRLGLLEAELGGQVTIADISPKMLEIASASAHSRNLEIETAVVDLTAAPLRIEGAPFDSVSAMWGLRYVDDPTTVIASLASQIRDAGTLVLVEFVEPSRGLIPTLAAFYFFRILPRLASFLAGRPELYSCLVETTHRMGPAGRLEALVDSAGLKVAETRSMGFGLVYGIVATKDAREEPRPG